jgi:phosphoglycolate phosphatase
VHDLAEQLGTPAAALDAGVEACIARYVELLQDEVDRGTIEVLPGVEELVRALAADGRVTLGLLTGNVAAGARIKLEPTGLWPLFEVAAYGSDSGSRPDLPAVAVARAEELTGRRFAGKEVAVIGDTPADIECGASLGVKAIAVATGRHGVEELAARHPDHLFTDFSDWSAAFAAILA